MVHDEEYFTVSEWTFYYVNFWLISLLPSLKIMICLFSYSAQILHPYLLSSMVSSSWFSYYSTKLFSR